MIARWLAGVVAAGCAGGGSWLAAHHPVSPALVLTVALFLAVTCFVRPIQWPLWLLPLMPVVGFMPWTGWLLVEEFDIAVLAVACGAYARMSLRWPAQIGVGARPLWALLWIAPLLLSTLVSMRIGMLGAGGLQWGWWQGYREPMNSLRLAKPVFETLLLYPIWIAASRADDLRSSRALRSGMLLVLLGVAGGVIWERVAFTGLMNFSSDYRATGLFWEMHIGGAALDAALAMALPFAVAVLAAAHTPMRWIAAVVLLGLGLYSSLVTFSRIVYFAVPLGVLVWGVLHVSANRGVARPRHWAPLWTWLGGFAVATAWSFQSSGYRGVLALLGAVALLLPLGAALRALRPKGWTLGMSLGMTLMALAAGIGVWLPKGTYLAFGVTWVVGAFALWVGRTKPGGPGTVVALAAFLGTVSSLVTIALHWGGERTLPSGLAIAATLLAGAAISGSRSTPAWPESWRWQGQLLCALGVLAAVIAVFGGGAYMGARVSHSGQDGKGRAEHWSRAVALLHGGDWVFGRGLGRYWAIQSESGRDDDQTGDLRLLPKDESRGQTVVLTSGRHNLGPSQELRLSQRVQLPAPGTATLRLAIRADQPTRVDASVCTKQLLYPGTCQGKQLNIQTHPGNWQQIELKLTGASIPVGEWYAPPPIVFSISLGETATRVVLDGLSLTDAAGAELLRNGDFERGLAHWYFTSDRNHMPWHAKNLAVHLLVEQGLFGLGAFFLVVGAALWRTSLGASKGHQLAAPLAGAIVALLAVGLVDSILDMPRVAFLTLLLLFIALGLPEGARRLNSPPGP